jgi:serine phosphatase RsbU (regulator of sigma subunit)
MGFKRRRAEGGMAGAAVMLAFAANFQRELRLIHIGISTRVFGFAVTLGTISTILSLLIITVMLLRRFVYSQRLQEQWKLEIEQARSIQHVLIPERLPAIKGLRIRSEYHPAHEVGGDFFQILPLDDDGAALIVVGDVTGKGLQAGMLVALMVGAIRTAVEQTTNPAQILAIINDQMTEREHATATCEVLRISSDGALTLSHAGHPPPYLNGREVQMEGALPLGMISGIEFPSQSLQLRPGDELTLMSDGVAEAQDSRGQLFGFDRVHEMMSGHATAEEIAMAAQKFGQADDITVLQVQWLGQDASVEFASEPQLAAH